MNGRWALLPGLLLVVAVSAVATLVSKVSVLLGAPVVGMVLGVLIALVRPPGAMLRPGVSLAARRCLRVALVLFGTELSLGHVARIGARSIPVILGALAVALGCTLVFARMLKVKGNLRILIGVGTGVCGTSAIAAITPIIGAAESDIAYAVGSIFALNTLAVVLFPILGHLMGMSQAAFGLWSGTAIHDTSSVLAAAYTIGPVAGHTSVVVKLTRSLMIIPIALGLALHVAQARGTADRPKLSWRRIVPLFVFGFLAAVVVNSLGLIPHGWHPVLSSIAKFLVTLALTGIGLSLRLADIRKAGLRPLLLASTVWVCVAVASLALQLLVNLD